MSVRRFPGASPPSIRKNARNQMTSPVSHQKLIYRPALVTFLVRIIPPAILRPTATPNFHARHKFEVNFSARSDTRTAVERTKC